MENNSDEISIDGENSAELTQSKVEMIRDQLLQSILSDRKVSIWHLYWKTLSLFVIGVASKHELEEVIRNNLTFDESE